MALLMRYRRWWPIFFFITLLLPTVGLLFEDVYRTQRPVSAPAPRWWLNAAERLDRYIESSYGFRAAVLYAHNSFGYWLGGGGNANVIVGKEGVLFYKKDRALEQSFGELIRAGRVKAAVETAAELDAWTKTRGSRFVMVVGPNAHTMNWRYLPDYTRQTRPFRTEYDLLAQMMEDRGLPLVDLRIVLEAAAEDGPIYWVNDTHWNNRSAIIAFNETMTALDRPDLTHDLSEVLGERYEIWHGDLVSMLGLPEAWTPDVDNSLMGSAAPPSWPPDQIEGIFDPSKEARFPAPYAYDLDRDGPRIMVIGDSFTRSFWAGALARRASAVAWMHHKGCKFDRGAIERFRPDLLIYAPTERAFPCPP